MASYIGVKCPVCSKKFLEADDIVVCPTCGAPHHRECYFEKGSCFFEADHLDGKVWQSPQEKPPETVSGVKTCPRCGGQNVPDSLFCQICGTRIAAVAPESAASGAAETVRQAGGFTMPVDTVSLKYGNLSPDSDIDGEPVRDIAEYIGNNSAYYLPRFEEMSKTGRIFNINFAAFIFGFFYYFYRKMYKTGAILLACFIVSLIPQMLLEVYSAPQRLAQMEGTAAYEALMKSGLNVTTEVNEQAVNRFGNLARIARSTMMTITLVVAMCANRFYYEKSITRVHAIREAHTGQEGSPGYVAALRQGGGVDKTAVSIVVSVVLFVGSVMCVLYPMYKFFY